MQEEARSLRRRAEGGAGAGYAEADPTFDIGGFDTAHKLALLTSLAFGTEVALRRRSMSKASRPSRPADIEAADELGYRIKLLGVAHAHRERHRAARASRHGAEGLRDRRGRRRHQRGRHRRRFCRRPRCSSAPAPAGRPTASAVVGDLVDIAAAAVSAAVRPAAPPSSARPTRGADAAPRGRLLRPPLALSTGPAPWPPSPRRMAEQDISLESIVQRGRDERPHGGDDAKRADKPRRWS